MRVIDFDVSALYSFKRGTNPIPTIGHNPRSVSQEVSHTQNGNFSYSVSLPLMPLQSQVNYNSALHLHLVLFFKKYLEHVTSIRMFKFWKFPNRN